jgi:hypothetical protein
MAYLLGQLDLNPDMRRALDLLKRAAVVADQVADVETATPLFVCGSRDLAYPLPRGRHGAQGA